MTRKSLQGLYFLWNLPNLFLVSLRETQPMKLQGVLKPFPKKCYKESCSSKKGLDGFFLKQCHGLALKVKPFKIFIAIHDFIVSIRSEDRDFNQ